MYIKILGLSLASSTEARVMSSLFKFKTSIHIIWNILYYCKTKIQFAFSNLKAISFNLWHYFREQIWRQKNKGFWDRCIDEFIIPVKFIKCFSYRPVTSIHFQKCYLLFTYFSFSAILTSDGWLQRSGWDYSGIILVETIQALFSSK